MPRTNHRWRHLLPSIALAIVLGGCIAGLRRGDDVDGDWPAYGNDAGGTRYSPLAQIDRGNVGRLRVAWTYRTGDTTGTASSHVAFEATLSNGHAGIFFQAAGSTLKSIAQSGDTIDGAKLSTDFSGPVITNHVKTSTATITEYSSALPAGKKVLVEHAQDGFNASITRTVTDAAGHAIDNWTARSHYTPAHNRYLVGTGR